MKIYLCGPINGCTDTECKDWREDAKKVLPDTLDPMRRDFRGREDDCCKEIVEGDKSDINQCDAILVNYDRQSAGTSMEIFYAWHTAKKVVVVAKPGMVISPWIKYHSHSIVNSFENAFEILKRIEVEKEEYLKSLDEFYDEMEERILDPSKRL